MLLGQRSLATPGITLEYMPETYDGHRGGSLLTRE
jgi:hypothetical protein